MKFGSGYHTFSGVAWAGYITLGEVSRYQSS
jgi:hypothetical protein